MGEIQCSERRNKKNKKYENVVIQRSFHEGKDKGKCHLSSMVAVDNFSHTCTNIPHHTNNSELMKMIEDFTNQFDRYCMKRYDNFV